ncbi:hypothetical protein GEMRC1_007129 [Eukaryota sp. GEM-RC1]
MSKLKTAKRTLLLRTMTKVRPVRRNVTRWSSTYKLIKRYFELLPFIRRFDEELLMLLPTPIEELNLQRLMESCETTLSSCTVMLQQEELNLSQANDIFTVFHQDFPEHVLYTTYPLPRQCSIRPSVLEVAVIKVLNSELDSLTPEERSVLHPFEVEQSLSDLPLGRLFSDRVKQLSSIRRSVALYQDLSWIPSTSVVVERLFSRARLSLGMLRHNLSSSRLHMELFLRANYELWDVNTVRRALKRAPSVIVDVEESD